MIKKSHLKLISLILLVNLCLLSCTIQKRTFNRGYHIEWKSSEKLSNNNSSINFFVEEENQKTESIQANEESKTTVLESNSDLDELIPLNESVINEDSSKVENKIKSKDSTEMGEFYYKGEYYSAPKKAIKELKNSLGVSRAFLILSLLILFCVGSLIFQTSIEIASLSIFFLALGVFFGSIIALFFIILASIAYSNYHTMAQKMIQKDYSENEKTQSEKTVKSYEKKVNPNEKSNGKIFLLVFLLAIISIIFIYER